MEYNWIAVTAACLCIKRAKFDGVGGFDETFPVAYNDVELCFRLCEAGLYNVVRNDVVLYHYESVSRGNDAVDKEKIKRLARELGRLYKKHPNFDRRDPFYNPAFSKTRPDFMLDSALYGEPDKIVRTNTDITKYISPRVKAELRRAKDSSILNVTGYAYVEGAVLNNLNTCRLLLVDAKNKAVEISAEKMATYYNALLSAFPEGNNFTPDVITEVWAGIVNANQDYMRYVSYLNPIIETNVTVERLTLFKKKYYDLAYAFRDRLAQMLGTTQEVAYKIQLDVLFYASSNAVCCYKNPLVQEALKQINITPPPMDFYKDMKEFLKMRLAWKS